MIGGTEWRALSQQARPMVTDADVGLSSFGPGAASLAAALQAQTIDPANTGVYEEIADADLAQER